MAEPTIQLGGGNWAGKTDNLLGYYKEGERFYKQDFTFSRSTTGTYTDKDGYIQEMPYNLLTYSEDLTNTYSRTNSTITSGQSGYNGTNDAWLFDVSVAGGNLRKNISVIGDNNFSIYAKKGSANGVRIRFDQDTDTNVYIDLTDGSVFTSANTLSVNVDSIGNGWYRINFSFVALGLILFRIYTTDGTTTTTTGSIFLQSPQLVKGTSAKTYFPTTTRLNMPRVSYLNNSNGSLILEPQRSNLVTYSSDFSNVAWIKDNVTITSDASTSPEGISNATKLIPNTSTALHRLRSNTITISTNGAYSAFVKADGYSKVALREDNAVGNYASFDLSNGSVLDENASGVADIDSYGNGWYRIYFVDNAVSATCQLSFYVLPDSYTSGSPTATNWAGDGTSGIYIYGAQVEAGSYATSYIPTSGSTVTRLADSASKTGVSSLIGQTEGTLFVEGTFSALSSDAIRMVTLSDGTLLNRIVIQNERNTNNLQFVVINGNAQQVLIAKTDAFVFGQTFKAAFAYKANDFAVYLDGVLIGTDTSGTVPSCSKLVFGRANESTLHEGNINQAMLFKSRLSNAELETLTTL